MNAQHTFVIIRWHTWDKIYIIALRISAIPGHGEYRSSRTEEPFQELNKKSAALKRILSRIPDEITDRKTFLETIKWVDSYIR